MRNVYRLILQVNWISTKSGWICGKIKIDRRISFGAQKTFLEPMDCVLESVKSIASLQMGVGFCQQVEGCSLFITFDEWLQMAHLKVEGVKLTIKCVSEGIFCESVSHLRSFCLINSNCMPGYKSYVLLRLQGLF